jgi:AraC-like DNA-binding protein
MHRTLADRLEDRRAERALERGDDLSIEELAEVAGTEEYDPTHPMPWGNWRARSRATRMGQGLATRRMILARWTALGGNVEATKTIATERGCSTSAVRKQLRMAGEDPT